MHSLSRRQYWPRLLTLVLHTIESMQRFQNSCHRRMEMPEWLHPNRFLHNFA
jgi:hypothetical protein